MRHFLVEMSAIYCTSVFGQHSPNEANVGADEISDPRKSGRATSVI